MLTAGRVRFPETVEYGDVVAGLPVPDGACEAVYCSHVLEHLSLADFRKALAEAFRILSAGGVFRGVLPDLEHYVELYRRDGGEEAAHDFMRGTLLGEETRARGLPALATALLGNSQHRWMWDYKGIAAELRRAGFINVRRAEMGDERTDLFGTVEDPGRWVNCLGFRADRPADHRSAAAHVEAYTGGDG